ncbi:hypothetical protein FE257_002799 [Aspergillus nanangensis]|uniref:GPI anchored protein n=1 Tax=Aspergillus nanangensis TaxID=2582783 RepID=A0AAD4GNW0_ASPNN|nr:hypothetical protein FE257_002799 [Aspergillus nanangensis]
MILNNALSLFVASTTLYQQFMAQEARQLPTLLDRGMSPIENTLNKRDVCSDGYECFIGNCCGNKCAENCCGFDQGGVGCGLTESCSFEGNVFIGCCVVDAPARQPESQSSLPTVLSLSASAGKETTTADMTLTSPTEQTFTLPTVDSSTPTAKTTASSAETGASSTGETSSSASSTGTEMSSGSSVPAATTTSEGVAPMVTASVPSGVNVGALAILGAWMAL